MRALLVVALLLASAFLVPPADAAEPFLSDAKGDAQAVVVVAGTPAPAPGASNPELTDSGDLLSLEIGETEDDLSFTIAVTSFKGTLPGSASTIAFTWDKQEFRVRLSYYGNPIAGGGASARLTEIHDGDEEFVAFTTPTVDVEKGTISAAFPKVYLLGNGERPPGRGDALESVSVSSLRNLASLGLGQLRVVDSMPDSGEGPAFTLQLGDFTQGHVVLTASERVRVSNGGATTFVYQVGVENTADAEDEFDLGIDGLPEGWNATLQSPLKLAGKQAKTVTILASVPFAHEHGGYSAFNVTVKSRADPQTTARMKLGVLHTPIPQPAGHHSELYLHASDAYGTNPVNAPFRTLFPFSVGWMNTDSEHAEDATFVSPDEYPQEGPQWWIWLNPGLQMGLDFDLLRTGTLSASVGGMARGEVAYTAKLYYVQGDGDNAERLLLAESDSAPVTLQPNTMQSFSLTLTPTAESDYVPYAQNQNMVLVVQQEGWGETGSGTGATLPQLQTQDFLLKLPLNEYHDRLDGTVETATSGVQLVADGVVEKAGRPGTVLTYLFDLKNTGSAEDVFDVTIAGSDAKYGSVIPFGPVPLAPGETKRVTLGVQLPANANDGEQFEVLVFVHARDDPSKTAIGRTVTTVTLTGEASQDETAVLLEARNKELNTPGPGVPLALAALAVALILARRR